MAYIVFLINALLVKLFFGIIVEDNWEEMFINL